MAPVKKVLRCPEQPGRACKKLLGKRPRVVTAEELLEVPRQGTPPGGRREWVGTERAIQLLFIQEGPWKLSLWMVLLLVFVRWCYRKIVNTTAYGP